MRPEEWRDVVGLEGRYAVSSQGRVRSHVRTVPRVLRPKTTRDGYRVVTLSAGNQRRRQYGIHTLMLYAFVGPMTYPNTLARHLDGRPGHNVIGNIAWGTNSQNMKDRKRHKTQPLGKKCSRAILTEEQVRDIRTRPTYYGIGRRLAEEFYVDPMTIHCIRKRKSWKHLP